MEAFKLQTVADLLVHPDERVELIGGEIVRRPMARFVHGRAQGCTFRQLGPLDRSDGPGGGWWIATEVSVAYETHECPSHDLAGWRRQRLPQLPEGVIDLSPDWVCEIVSPGHEIKDTRHLPLLLKRHRVPWYWLLWPEARTLMAHALRDGEWQTILTLQVTGSKIGQSTDRTRARIPPFDAIELDLVDLLGIDG
jgi:Uma2 family endonuclease